MDETRIREVADCCLARWFKHFETFYLTLIPGDREKKNGLIMGIESLRDDLIRAIREERKEE